MERSHLPSGPPPGTGPGTAPWRRATGETIVLREPGAAGYGRHAAPPSAYGPADVHRLLPVSPSAPRVAGAEAVRAAGGGTGAGSADVVPARTSGLLARLRLLPRAA